METQGRTLIVVVNDDPTQLCLLSGVLEEAGLEARGFSSARAALQFMLTVAVSPADAGQVLPSLVITDLCMPDIDGWQFCHMLHSEEYHPLNHIPVLAVSMPFAGAEHQQIAADLGASAFLPLPVNGEVLLEHVEAILRGDLVPTRTRVLIVEDNQVQSKILKDVFEERGWSVEIAASGRAALDCFEKGVFDLAVLDYFLPDTTGDVVLDSFHARRPEGVYVMITADAGAELPLDWAKRGASACVQKPFHPAYLFELCSLGLRERGFRRTQELLETRTRQFWERDQLLRDTQRLAKTGGWEWDLATNKLAWTAEMYRLCSTEPELTLSEPATLWAQCLEGFSEQDRIVLDEAFRRCIGLGESYVLEIPFVTGLRTDSWLRIAGQPVYDNGRVVKVRGHVSDITERKLNDLALEKHEAYLRTILETTADSFYLLDSQGRITDANKACCATLGYTLAEIRERCLWDIDDSNTPAGFLALLSRIAQQGTQVFETRLRRRDGSTVPVENSVTFTMHDGGRFVTFCRDITGRKHAEDRVRRMAQLYATISQSNESIVRSTSADDLLARVCRDAVVYGGASFAWAALLEPEKHTLVPVVSYGQGVEIGDDLTAQIKEDDPLLAALEKPAAYWFQLETRKPEETFGRSMSERFGWKTIAMLPFRRDERHTGFLCLCSFLPEVFDDEIKDLLNRAMDNVNFALGKFADEEKRKRTEKALGESEERIRLISENIEEVFWMADPELQQMLYVSPSFEKIWGLPRERLLENPKIFLDSVHPEDRERVLQDYSKKQQSLPFDHEYRIVLPDGTIRHIWDQGVPVRDANGEVTSYAGVAADITSRKWAEAETGRVNRSRAMVTQCHIELLRAEHEEQLLRAICGLIVESGGYALAWVGLVDPDAKHALRPAAWTGELEFVQQTINASSGKDWGHGPLGTALCEQRVVVVQDTRDRAFVSWFTGAIQRGFDSLMALPLVKGGETFGLLVIYSRSTEAFNPQEVALLTELAGNMSFGINALRTQQERAAISEELAHTNLLLRNTFAAITDLLTVQDRDLRVVYSNWHGARAVPGPDQGEPPLCYECFARQKQPCEGCPTLEVFRTGRVVTHEMENPVNGKISEITAYPVFNPPGHVEYVIEHIRDITQRRRNEEEKTLLEAELYQAQKMESIGLLAGGIAHDFNNALQAIIFNVELSKSYLPEGSVFRERLEDIDRCAQHSTDLTRQLLAFARKQVVAPKRLQLSETTAGLLKMLKRLIGEDIQLNLVSDPGLWEVEIDPSQVDQILVNLCVNARDAINGVGEITIETGNLNIDREFCAKHPAFLPGGYVYLKVSDTGSGMPPEVLDHIFEPFYTTKDLGRGTGLGLATVYGAVKQNGGFIDVVSKIGEGTVFTIFLPRAAANSAHIREERSSATPKTAVVPGAVLVVEDDPFILKTIVSLLQQHGFNVLAANHPHEALQLAKTFAKDLEIIISDVVMPDMRGSEMVAQMLPLCSRAKYLFMSAYTVDVNVERIRSGIDACFIEKPFTTKALLDKIRGMLESSYPQERVNG